MAPTAETRFASRLRVELETQRLSIRGLARRIDPENVDRARRNIHRWLDEGIVPQRASRREVAHALGLDENELEDDEEGDPAVAEFLEALRPVAVLLARRTEPVLAEERV